MDFRTLRFAISLAAELHFGRAAERHSFTGQAFGWHIVRLECELGDTLVRRMGRHVALTPAAHQPGHAARSAFLSTFP
jgi:DNA-binding transcriptional LysR family regulator